MKYLKTAAAAALTLAFSVAQAAPIDIVEGADWESVNPFAPTIHGDVLDGDGQNTISGSVASDDPLDAVFVGINAGNIVQEIRISITNFTGVGEGNAFYDSSLSSHIFPLGEVIDGDEVITLDPFAAGAFDAFIVSVSGTASFDYEWQIDVIGDSSGIPAPSGVALLGLGLLALARSRRRS